MLGWQQLAGPAAAVIDPLPPHQRALLLLLLLLLVLRHVSPRICCHGHCCCVGWVYRW
jgi:hypothetical protein